MIGRVGAVLVEQQIANQMKYPKKTVGQVLAENKLEIVKFVRLKVGGQN